MSNKAQTQILLRKLNEILEYCYNIEKLLNNDLDNFKKNNLREFILNSEKERDEIEKIAGIIQSIKQKYNIECNGELSTLLKNKHKQFDSITENELKKIFSELKKSINNIFSIMSTNNQIIFNNLQQFKSLFATIVQSQNNIHHYYKENGKLNYEE